MSAVWFPPNVKDEELALQVQLPYYRHRRCLVHWRHNCFRHRWYWVAAILRREISRTLSLVLCALLLCPWHSWNGKKRGQHHENKAKDKFSFIKCSSGDAHRNYSWSMRSVYFRNFSKARVTFWACDAYVNDPRTFFETEEQVSWSLGENSKSLQKVF